MLAPFVKTRETALRATNGVANLQGTDRDEAVRVANEYNEWKKFNTTSDSVLANTDNKTLLEVVTESLPTTSATC